MTPAPGEVAILDAIGNEIVRHGRSKFPGEGNLLSGQTEYVTAEVREPLRYIAVGRESLGGLRGDLITSQSRGRSDPVRS